MDDIAYGLIMRELSGRIQVSGVCFVQGALVMYLSLPLAAKTAAKMAAQLKSVQSSGCFGLTDSHGGSDPEAMQTKAFAQKNGYLLNGAKMWITNGSMAQIAIVWAKLGTEVRGFIVPCDSRGMTVKTMRGKLSLRASVTSELYFTDVLVAKENILPHAIGMKAALSCLTQARYGIAWGAVGAAEACYAEVLAYVHERSSRKSLATNATGTPQASLMLMTYARKF